MPYCFRLLQADIFPQKLSRRCVMVISDAASGVACTSTKYCVAVDNGGGVYTYDGTSWSAVSAIDAGHALIRVSCADKSFCAAIGSLSCASATFCVAIDNQGQAVYYRPE